MRLHMLSFFTDLHTMDTVTHMKDMGMDIWTTVHLNTHTATSSTTSVSSLLSITAALLLNTI